jgi:hypothetical protein
MIHRVRSKHQEVAVYYNPDTANFEKFSARVDALACGMDETRREISIVKNLFQGEHESLTMEIMDLGQLLRRIHTRLLNQ